MNASHYSEIINIWESAVKATYSFEKPEDFKFYKHLGATDLSSTVDLYVLQSTEKIIGFMEFQANISRYFLLMLSQ